MLKCLCSQEWQRQQEQDVCYAQVEDKDVRDAPAAPLSGQDGQEQSIPQQTRNQQGQVQEWDPHCSTRPELRLILVVIVVIVVVGFVLLKYSTKVHFKSHLCRKNK